MIVPFRDVSTAVTELSRLGRSQLLLVFVGSLVSVVLSGICTDWSGSAFYATLAFLICDIVNAMYSITYENAFAFTSLALLLVEQNAVLTASSAVGILDKIPSWAPASLNWIAVACGWLVLVILLGLQLALRKDWGWHAHKIGLARIEDVHLYSRLQQLEGAVLLDLCQLLPCTVVVIGRYGLGGSGAVATPSPTPSAAPHSHNNNSALSLVTPTPPVTRKPGDEGTTLDADDDLAQAVAVLFFCTAVLSCLSAPVLATSARREKAGLFAAASAVTMLATGAIAFGSSDAIRRVWPPVPSDTILVALIITTGVVRLVLLAAMARVHAIFGSGIASRINRGDGGILLPGNIEGWSECRRSGFGGNTSNAADTEGGAILIGNVDDCSDTESDIGGLSSTPNLMYGERVRVRVASSVHHPHNHHNSSQGGNYGSIAADHQYSHGNLNQSTGPGARPSFVTSGTGSMLSGAGGGGGAGSASMVTLARSSIAGGAGGGTYDQPLLSDSSLQPQQQQQQQQAHTPRTISFVRANQGKRPVSPNTSTLGGQVFPEK